MENALDYISKSIEFPPGMSVEIHEATSPGWVGLTKLETGQRYISLRVPQCRFLVQLAIPLDRIPETIEESQSIIPVLTRARDTLIGHVKFLHEFEAITALGMTNEEDQLSVLVAADIANQMRVRLDPPSGTRLDVMVSLKSGSCECEKCRERGVCGAILPGDILVDVRNLAAPEKVWTKNHRLASVREVAQFVTDTGGIVYSESVLEHAVRDAQTLLDEVYTTALTAHQSALHTN